MRNRRHARMVVIFTPEAASARSAASRPAPARTPRPRLAKPHIDACDAVFCRHLGSERRGLPGARRLGDRIAQHDMPWTSVMVIMVLLNVEWMWATPLWTTFQVATFLICHRLLPRCRLARTLTGARIVGTLSTSGQSATMPKPSVAAEIHQSLERR